MLETAQKIAARESPRITKLYDEFQKLEELHKQGMSPQFLEKFYRHVISQTQEARDGIESIIPDLRRYAGSKVIKATALPRLSNPEPSTQIGPGAAPPV